jgi:hypothetical protein
MMMLTEPELVNYFSEVVKANTVAITKSADERDGSDEIRRSVRSSLPHVGQDQCMQMRSLCNLFKEKMKSNRGHDCLR